MGEEACASHADEVYVINIVLVRVIGLSIYPTMYYSQSVIVFVCGAYIVILAVHHTVATTGRVVDPTMVAYDCGDMHQG